MSSKRKSVVPRTIRKNRYTVPVTKAAKPNSKKRKR